MGVILMELTDDNYYQTKMLSVSSVRLFAQNPARALADFTGQCPWFDNLKALPLGSAFHDMLERAIRYTCNKKNVPAAAIALVTSRRAGRPAAWAFNAAQSTFSAVSMHFRLHHVDARFNCP